MSFFGDLVNSIGGEQAPAPPIRPPQRPASTNPPLAYPSKSETATPPAVSAVKAAYKGTAGTAVAPQQGSSLKRKADDITSERPVKLPKPISNAQTSDQGGQKPSKLNGTDTKSPTNSKNTNGLPIQSAQNAVKPPAKAPAKGSYAEIMARAKEAQQNKTPSQIGTIKHQATEKDKIKHSRLAERSKKDEHEKGKGLATGRDGKSGFQGKSDSRRRSVSPVKTTKKGEMITPKQPKLPSGPLHGPPRLHAPAYKGTMGQTPKKAREAPRKHRNDEYLGTDEEDEGDYGDYDEDEYYSDASSDMEGGLDDIEMEERKALKAARDDDAKELALENQLKREKLERQKKLAAMAAKRR